MSGSFLLLPVALIVLGGYVETGLEERPVRTLACLAAAAAGYVGLARAAFRRRDA